MFPVRMYRYFTQSANLSKISRGKGLPAITCMQVHNTMLRFAKVLRKTKPETADCEPRSKPYITRTAVIFAQMWVYRNAKVKLRIAEGLRKVRTMLNASVDAGFMIIAHVLIYRFIEVGCAKRYPETANCARLCAKRNRYRLCTNQLPSFPAIPLCRFHAE